MTTRKYSRPLSLRLPILIFPGCLTLVLILWFLEPYLKGVDVAFTIKAHPSDPTTTSNARYEHLPHPPPLFTHTPEDLIRSTIDLLDSRKKHEDQLVASVSTHDASFENIISQLASEENIRLQQVNLIAFYRYVASSGELRNASTAAVQLIAEKEVDALLREDVYNLINAVFQKGPILNPESGRLIRRFRNIYTRSGLGVAQGPNRTRFAEIQKRLSTITASFLSNLGETSRSLIFGLEDLDGVSIDVIQGYNGMEQRAASGLSAVIQLPLDPPVLTAVSRYCKNATTRQRMFLAGETRHSHNIALFKEAVALRDEAARLLGYSNHAALRIKDMMAKTPNTVEAFLKDIQQRLAPVGAAEIQQLSMLKKAEMDSEASTFSLWDYDYYDTMRIELEQGLDEEKVAEFFTLENTVSSMLAIFAALFGLQFHKVEAKGYPDLFESGAVWHADVQMYSVRNDYEGGGGFVGYLYLDLHPRDGKFGGAANFNVRPGFRMQDGTQSYPATALVCNFAKSTTTKPSLLRHDEIVTLFHELGHSIHDIVSRTIYACFHGTSTSQDFVEAPSQMLENWCWEPSVIKALSKHYSYLTPSYYETWRQDNIGNQDRERPLESISEGLIERILNAKRSNRAGAHLRSVHWSMFDMAVHRPTSHTEINDLDPSATYNRLRHNITMLDGPEILDGRYDWAHGYTSDGHLFQGYDASNYAYLYSLVFSADMFDSVFKDDPMNGTAGRRYRRIVLERGGSMDEMEILREFLGRTPAADAFYRMLGI